MTPSWNVLCHHYIIVCMPHWKSSMLLSAQDKPAASHTHQAVHTTMWCILNSCNLCLAASHTCSESVPRAGAPYVLCTCACTCTCTYKCSNQALTTNLQVVKELMLPVTQHRSLPCLAHCNIAQHCRSAFYYVNRTE